MTADKKSNQKTFDEIIATFLKNAPSKEGCPKYKVSQAVFVWSSIDCHWVVKQKFENFSAAEMRNCIVPKLDSDLSHKHLYSDTKYGLNGSMPISRIFQFINIWMINDWYMFYYHLLFYISTSCTLTCVPNHSWKDYRLMWCAKYFGVFVLCMYTCMKVKLQ